ncbi:MAG: PEP-CTERM sorting domain-containing protein [Planctomycetota bacterium]
MERPPPLIPGPLVAISSTDSNVLTFQLNADAITNINVAAGGFFSIGGTLLTLDGTTNYFGDEGLFGFSYGTRPQRLILEVVPEPATLLLLAVGWVIVTARRPRKACKPSKL